MDRNCNKYESYSIFGNEEDLKKHLLECEECKKEYENHQKLSALIKDAGKTYYKMKNKEKTKKTMSKIACSFLFLALIGTYTGFQNKEQQKYQYFANMQEVSVIEEYGLPTDDLGFFDYN